jgi:predicted permease
MRWTHELKLRIRSLLSRDRVEQELSDELRFHLEKLIEDYAGRGISLAEARYKALRELGGVDQVKEECRDMRRVNYIENFVQDVRYGLRMLAKNPGFTAVAVLTLALGIGINTTLFTAFDAVALKALPVREPNSVVRLVRTLASGYVGDVQYAFSYPEYVYYRDHSDVFSGLVAASWPVQVLAMLPGEGRAGSPEFGETQAVQGQLVSANYFAALGIPAAVGRTFLSEEDQAPGAHPVVVLSYPCWQRRFNSDSRVVGKVIKLNDTDFTVVGIAPRDFIGTANPPVVPDFWTPLAMQPRLLGGDWLNRPTDYQIQLLGRLGTTTGLSRAQAEVTVLARQFQEAQVKTAEQDKTLAVILERATFFGGTNDIRFRAFIALLMVLVGLVLLVACANLANMLLARSVGRQREVAVRLAMGAGRERLVRQWLTETILLALLGGAAALLLSLWTTQVLWLAVAPIIQGLLYFNPSIIPMSPDFRVFGYTLLLSIATGVAFGLSPALQFSRPHLLTALKDEGTALSQRVSGSRLRGFLVSGQVAVSVLLLITAGLLVRGLLRSQTVDPGFETQKVFPIWASFLSEPAKANALTRRVMDRMAGVPAVQSMGLVYRPPWSGTWTPPVLVEGTKAPPRSLPWQVLANYVSPGYFPTLGVPILRGRNFSRFEGNKGAPVIILSESAARRFWPGEDPLGKKLKLDLSFKGQWAEFEVVGVAKDVRTANLSRVDPGYAYLPTTATNLYEYTLLLRTQGDTRTALASVRTALEDLDRSQFPPGMQLNSLEEGPLRTQRLMPQAIAYFAASLGVLVLLLAVVGIYGVTSYTTSQRTREIGVRMALGARPPDTLRWAVRQGMRPVVVGAIVGVACSIGISTVLRAILVSPGSTDLLFGVGAFDPATFIGLSSFVGSVALVACFIPALRATKVDPMAALRYE